jgi:cell division protein FtsB
MLNNLKKKRRWRRLIITLGLAGALGWAATQNFTLKEIDTQISQVQQQKSRTRAEQQVIRKQMAKIETEAKKINSYRKKLPSDFDNLNIKLELVEKELLPEMIANYESFMDIIEEIDEIGLNKSEIS